MGKHLKDKENNDDVSMMGVNDYETVFNSIFSLVEKSDDKDYKN